MRRASSSAVEGQPSSGLRSWREVVTPHPDVVRGTYQQTEFAADLWKVHLGHGDNTSRMGA